MKIVINRKFGGFGLSDEAMSWLKERGHTNISRYNMKRNDPLLIECVEKLGDKVNCCYAKLKIVEIPDNVEYEIMEYDGLEEVREMSRIWK